MRALRLRVDRASKCYLANAFTFAAVDSILLCVESNIHNQRVTHRLLPESMHVRVCVSWSVDVCAFIMAQDK